MRKSHFATASFRFYNGRDRIISGSFAIKNHLVNQSFMIEKFLNEAVITEKALRRKNLLQCFRVRSAAPKRR